MGMGMLIILFYRCNEINIYSSITVPTETCIISIDIIHIPLCEFRKIQRKREIRVAQSMILLMEEILHQLRLVVYPIIRKVL